MQIRVIGRANIRLDVKLITDPPGINGITVSICAQNNDKDKYMSVDHALVDQHDNVPLGDFIRIMRSIKDLIEKVQNV